jgi:hypothetical protein
MITPLESNKAMLDYMLDLKQKMHDELDEIKQDQYRNELDGFYAILLMEQKLKLAEYVLKKVM